MKIFVVGGVTNDENRTDERERVGAAARAVGLSIAAAGHDLVLCSPFDGAADPDVLRGAADTLRDRGAKVEFNFVDTPSVQSQLDRLAKEVGLIVTKIPHPPPPEKTEVAERYSWLLCQLRAMDSCHGVIALGGKKSGSANMLLLLAEGRRKIVLPLPTYGGCAVDSFYRQRYELEDRLGNDFSRLQNLDATEHVGAFINALATSEKSRAKNPRSHPRFFISYPRLRAAEADFVETLLRRRNQEVFRDEADFGAGHEVPTEIREAIYSSNVFIALWSKEYACSPWCHDEMELALERHERGELEMWILCVDDTRIVPPRARNLISFSIKSRHELEGRVVELLTRRLCSG